MGTWQLDDTLVGTTFYPQQFIHFKGSLYLSTAVDGVWERTAPGVWTQRFAPACLYNQHCVEFNGYLWSYSNTFVYRSVDGTTWVADFDIRTLTTPNIKCETINTDGECLYICGIDSVTGITYFLEQDIAGTWIISPAAGFGGGVLIGDFIQFGDYYYYTNSGGVILRWDGTSWGNVPGIPAYPGWYTVHDGVMYVKLNKVAWVTAWWVYWVDSDGTWTAIDSGGGNDSHYGRVSVGGDGNLWFAVCRPLGGNTWVYVRFQGPADPAAGWRWFNFTAVNANGYAASADDGGLVVYGTSEAPINIYRYVLNYDIHPGGGGVGVGNGLLPQAMDCDGDGNILYLGLYENVGNTPVLIRVNLPLVPAALGAEVFAPGDGDAINVKCAAVGSRLAIAGRFSIGGNDSVQISEDGGVTFTDIAPAWGDTAQPLLVDPDTIDEVAVALDTAQDLYDTEDQGVAWTQRNAAVGYSPGAMARLPDGDELVIGDDGANRIDYSPNRGQTLTDITAPFAGNVAALEVV